MKDEGETRLCYLLCLNYLVQAIYIEGTGGSHAEGVENMLLEQMTHEVKLNHSYVNQKPGTRHDW